MPGFDAGHPIPPIPHLRIEPRHHPGTLLFVRNSAVPPELRRFQIDPNRLGNSDPLAYLDAHDLLMVHGLRMFCASLQGNAVSRLNDQALVIWLEDQVKTGRLAALWIQTEGYLPPISTQPVKPASSFSPSMSAGQKIAAMFKAVPKFLGGAAKAQVEAFFSPENLAIMAGIMLAIAAAQAIPGADAVLDGVLMAIAWASTGWAGIMAVAHLIEAVAQASTAKTEGDIDDAAKLAAEALIALGLTAFLAKVLLKAKRLGARPPREEEPAAGSTNAMMKRFNEGNEGVSYPRSEDQFRTDSRYDPEHPTADQKMAADQLRMQRDASGKRVWNDDKVDQVLNSGSDFTTKSYAPGDNIYKIGSPDLNTATPSPYLLDQHGMNQLINKGYVNQDMQVTNPAGVKQTLALPCYNSAQKVFPGEVTAPTSGVVSQINPASELFSLSDGSGEVVEGQILMNGGGSQVSLPPSATSFGH